MVRTAVAGIAVVVLVLSGGGASATSIPAPAPAPAPAVAGTTVLKGDGTLTMNVRVPRDAVIDLTPTQRPDGTTWPTALRATGGRHYVGFLLTQRSTAEGLFVVGARLPRRLRSGDTVHRAIGYGQPAIADRTEPAFTPPWSDTTPPTCTRCRIPAGSYRLQLLTFGKPATVAITFEGLKGSTTLRPTTATNAFGFSSAFRPMGAPPHVADGGGMGMGMAWSWREPGVLLSTYEVDVTARTTPVAVTDARACRGLGDAEQCEDPRLTAGERPSLAGFGAMSGDRIGDGWTSLSFGTLGDTKWVARTSLLWLPTRAAPNVFELEVEAGGGTEAFATQVFR